MTRVGALQAVFVVAVLALSMGTSAFADVLVTTGGDEIETRGAWEVRGNMVVFTLPNGTLSSMRKSEVDLDASAIATRKATEPETEQETETEDAPEAEPVLVLTNEDIPRARGGGAPATSAAGDESGGSESSAEGTRAGSGTPAEGVVLTVTRWEVVENPLIDGLEIFGALENQSAVPVIGVGLTVQIPDGDGGILTEVGARVSARTLPNGGSTSFRALLRGLTSLPGDPVFIGTGQELGRKLPQQPRDAGDTTEAGTGD